MTIRNISRLKKYHLPHDGYKWRSDGRDKKWPQTTKIYYKCISVEGCSAKLHFYPHTKEIQYVGEHNHPKAGTGEEEEEQQVAPASPATATVVTVAACSAVIPPEVYQRPVRQSTRRQRSCVDAMSYLDDESEDNEDEEEEEEEYDDEEAYIPTNNYHSTATSPASSDIESSPARSRAAGMAARQRAHSKSDERQLVNIEEDVAIFLGAMQSEQKKEVSPTTISRKRKASDEGSPYMSEADDDDGGAPNTDNKCPHCGKVFQNRSTFVHHWRVVVQREQQRDCPICHEIISTWYNMKRHLGNVHKWSTQQIENERSRITSTASPQLGEAQPQQFLQVPTASPTLALTMTMTQQQQQQQQRRKKVKAEDTASESSPSKEQQLLHSPAEVEVKMEVVSAAEDEDDADSFSDAAIEDGSEATKHSSIRSRRAHKAARNSASAISSNQHAQALGGAERVGRVESMLERLVTLYEQDREERRAKCRAKSDLGELTSHQRHHQQQQQQQAPPVPIMKRELLQVKEQELRLREERLEMRERELEMREREQIARLQMREEAMLLRERELELIVRERTLAISLAATSASASLPQGQPQQQ